MKKNFLIFALSAMSMLYVAPILGRENTYHKENIGISQIIIESIPIEITGHSILCDTSLQVGAEKFTNTVVNMREESNSKSKIITTLEPNVEVISYFTRNGWSYVCLDNDTYGYVKLKYLSNDETSISELNRWGIELTTDEIELLAKILFREAGNQPYEGQAAVVECIFNRMVDDYFGGTLYEVLSKPGQFTTWAGRNKATPTSENYEVINDVLLGKTNVLSKEYLYFSRGGHKKHSGYRQIYDHQFCTKG